MCQDSALVCPADRRVEGGRSPMRRAFQVLVLTAMVAAMAAPLTATSASADDEHVGYTFGRQLLDGCSTGATACGATSTPPSTIDVKAAVFPPECDFFKIDLDSGELTRINPAGQLVPCADGVTFDDEGRLLAYRQNPNPSGIGDFTQLIKIDLDDGAQHVIGNLPAVFVGSGGMTSDAEGHLWLYGFGTKDPECNASGNTDCLWKVNAANAHSQLVGGNDTHIVEGLAATCEDVIAISLGELSTPVSLDAHADVAFAPAELDDVHTNNGHLEKIADAPGVTNPQGLDFDDEGELYAVGQGPIGKGPFGPALLFKIDPNNGNSGSTPVTLNGTPYVGELTGLGISPLSCDEETTTTTTPAAPVVAVQPNFTG
jgi:hypothetical protein